ncbi:hypothetical protein A6R68_05321, partial [Neotoma lepida]
MTFSRPRRTGERKQELVYRCIVDANLSVYNLVIVRKVEKDIPGLTDTSVPWMMSINMLLEKPLNKEGKKHMTKAPKILLEKCSAAQTL